MGTGPTNGNLTLNANGSFTYQPSNSVNGGDSFTYQANDLYSNLTAAKVTLTIIPNETWLGAVDASWATPGNWTGSSLPTNQNVFFDSNSVAHLTETLDQNWNILSLTLNNPSGPVTILDNGFALTNFGNLNMSNATQDLTIQTEYVPTNGVGPTIPAGRTLTINNMLGSMDNVTGYGTVRIKGTVTATSIAFWAA